MGVVKRQGIKHSLVNYVGVLIGTVNVFLIYPQVLELYGLVRFIIDTAQGIVPFFLMGVGNLAIRYFPDFKDEKSGHHGLLVNLFLGTLAAMLFCTLIVWLFWDPILSIYRDRSELILQHLIYVLPITWLIGYNSLLTQYISNFHRIVVPSVLEQFFKIFLPVLLLGQLYQFLVVHQVVQGIVVYYLIVFVSLLVYLRWLGEWRWKPDFAFLTRARLKEMGYYSLIGVLGNTGNVLAMRIDTIMVASMIDLKNTGVYAISLFIANVIEIPTKSIVNITAPLISEAWKENNLEKIRDLYQRSSINLLVFGLLLFIGIWASIDDLFSLIPKGEELRAGKYVVLFLGLAKLIDMATSINSRIIGYSRFFQFNLYFVLILGVLNVIFNLTLIPVFLINGAALATLSSMTLYNVLKLVFIYRKFGMSPFTRETLKLLVLAAFAYLAGFMVAPTQIPLVDILLRSALITLLFVGGVLYLKLSDDFSDLARNLISRVRSLLGKND